jgi:plasmid stabilization system protein ParE
MPTVLQTAGAQSDLLEIGRYISRESRSLDIALNFLDKIEQKCSLYASQPLMGTPRFDLGDNVHSFPVTSMSYSISRLRKEFRFC